MTTWTIPGAGSVTPLGSAPTLLFRTGRYVSPAHVTRSALAVTLDRLYYIPFRVQRTRTIDRIGVEVTTGVASAVARVGIYSDAATFNWPGSLLLDAGTIDSSAVGTPPLTVTVSQQLTPGLYWLAVAGQVAAATYRAAVFAEMVSSSAPDGSIAKSALIEVGVSGALPATATPGGDTNLAPVPFLRST